MNRFSDNSRNAQKGHFIQYVVFRLLHAMDFLLMASCPLCLTEWDFLNFIWQLFVAEIITDLTISLQPHYALVRQMWQIHSPCAKITSGWNAVRYHWPKAQLQNSDVLASALGILTPRLTSALGYVISGHLLLGTPVRSWELQRRCFCSGEWQSNVVTERSKHVSPGDGKSCSVDRSGGDFLFTGAR